jgi:DNA-binding IclR family transcriptional regulator
MPGSGPMMASSYGYAALAGIVLAILIAAAVWVRRGKTAAVQSAQEKNARIESEAARKDEQEVRDAADRIRRDPGPRLPDL